MSKVVPWPSSQHDEGYVNMHFSFPDKDDPKILHKKGGWPIRSVEGFISRVNFALTTPSRYKDIWYCTSLQKEAGVNSKGRPKAVRKKLNALRLNSIWVDIDVDDQPKHYHSVEEALTAILTFQIKVGLPAPSAIVFSGGGVHVYWTSKTPLTPQEWHPYADGLKQLLLINGIKCDAGLTTDSARILRVPGTLNYKYDPPRPVELAPGPFRLYDFEAKLGLLKGFAGPAASAAPVQGPALFADGVSSATFQKPSAAFNVLDAKAETLAEGIDKHEDFKLDPRPIFSKCGFYRTALKESGASYNQPLWMLSILGTTFMENGNDIAHKISEAHASYSAVDTQAMYDRKVAERSASGIGYPSCAAIAGNGSEACKSCPLFAQAKSPLNIKPEPPKFTATVSSGIQSQHALDQCIPEGFDLDANGVICKLIETVNKSGETTTHFIPVFQAVLSDFWLQKTPNEMINFTATVDKGFSEQVSVKMGDVSSQGFRGLLGHKRVLINPNITPKILEEFFLSTIGKLRAIAAAQQAVPFGWYEENGKRRGFAFDGQLMLDDGTTRPCGAVDYATQRKYKVTGNLADWKTAANVVFRRRRPELSAIALTAFASPLLALAGQKSMTMASWGSDSGAGKSSAYTIGMSVWGDPLLTKGTETSTVNAVTHAMKTIRNLPFYWDEISDDTHREKFAKVMMEADGGKEKDRMIDGQTALVGGIWRLMMQYASNGSLIEYLRKRNSNTTAAQMRVLEWEVKRIEGGPGYIGTTQATSDLALAESNFGHMGLLYARYLADHHVAIYDEVIKKSKEVEALLRTKQDERYWAMGIAIMCLAAKYAQGLGIEVDPAEIETFMYKVYQDNLTQRNEFAAGGRVDNSETVITRYLKERNAAERGIWTDHMHNTKGKPGRKVIITKGPTQPRNMEGGIEFRFAIENRELVISQEDFNAWLKEYKHSEALVYAALKTVYNTRRGRISLCSGTIHDIDRENCLVLTISKNSGLWGFMMVATSDEARTAMENEVEINPVKTGFEDATPRPPVTGTGVTADDVRALIGATGAH